MALAALVAAAAAPSPRRDDRSRPALRLPGALAILSPADGLGTVAGGWGDAWMDDRWGGRLLRVDRRTGTVIARIPVRGRLALSAGAGAMWALQAGDDFFGRRLNGPLLRIDPATNRVTARIALATPAGDPVAGYGVLARGASVWVWGPRELLRIDARTNALARVIELGDDRGETAGFALVRGAPVITTADGHLVGFDPLTGRQGAARALALAAPALQLASGRRAVLSASGSVATVDLVTGRQLWRTRLGYRVNTVLASGGVLLAQGANVHDPGDRVWMLDPRTGAVLGSALLPAFSSVGMAVIGGAVWVTTASGRALVLRRPRSAAPLSWPSARD
jgi:hypothetical protein